MNTGTSSGEVLMIVASWFLSKKKIRTGRNQPKKCKKTRMNAHRIQLWQNSYNFCILVSMKEKNSRI